MALNELDWQGSKTSTGTTTRLFCGQAREWTVYAETASASSATFILQTARDDGATSVAIPYGTTQNLNASSGVCMQFSGPAVLFARVTDLSGTITFRFLAS
jgi:hypothetical protein